MAVHPAPVTDAMPQRPPVDDRGPAGATSPRVTIRRTAAALLTLVLAAACGHQSPLTDADEQRLTSEGIVHRAADLEFRKSHDQGTRDAGWEEGLAAIVVTKESVTLYGRERILLQITPRSTGSYDVARRADRVVLHAGSGNSAVTWSFRPPDDADAWTQDIRRVIEQTRGAQRGAP